MSKRTEASPSRTFLKDQGESSAIFGYTNYRDFLASLFQELKGRDPGYSYNQFAEDLGFPPTNAIWMVLTGRRKISPMAMKRLIEALGLKNLQRRFFVALVKHNNASRLSEREAQLAEMLKIKAEALDAQGGNKEGLEYFSEWYFPVIREMVALPSFQADPNWIAQNLHMKILPKQAEYALELLQQLNLIRWDVRLKRFVQTSGTIDLSGDLLSFAAIRYHEKACDMAREAITRVPAKERDFNTTTLRLTPDKVQQLRKILAEFRSQLLAMESQDPEGAAQIYQINTQLFPITKKEE